MLVFAVGQPWRALDKTVGKCNVKVSDEGGVWGRGPQLTRDVAVVEYHEGSAERGRTLFESAISNYPKRLDLWSIYFDQVGAKL